jgi:hypothetical protein
MAGASWASRRVSSGRKRRNGRGSLTLARWFWGIVLVLCVVVVAWAGVAGSAVDTATPYRGGGLADATPNGSGPVRNFPAQAAALVYGPGSRAKPYAHRGGLVVAGRDNYRDRGFKDVSAAGGTVLIYLDTIIDNPHGRYHEMLLKRSKCGPATARWPGWPKANNWGYLNDFRVGSVLQQKLPCVLEAMVAENPYMAGWFADDLGSRSWFPGFSWESWGSANRQAYRKGAIALTRTFREVANRHGLIFLVNGTWGAGSLSSAGGGYPDAGKHGNALADGGVVEHHDGDIGYFGPYGCSGQWAARSPVTHGKAFNYAVTSTSAGRGVYVRSDCYAYVNKQSDYFDAAPWGSFHPTGLPSGVRR